MFNPNAKVSKFDEIAYKLIRNNITCFLKNESISINNDKEKNILEIAPQIHNDVKNIFSNSNIKTLDIDKNSSATYIADLTNINSGIIKNDEFDVVICMEVLEHTLNPFNAVKEIYRILNKGGILLMSTPYNFRIHGPLPDCWRFTVYGLYALLEEAGFKKQDIEIFELKTDDRDLMPLQYTLRAKKYQ